MFFLIIKAKNKEFINFINKQSRKIDDDSYLFKDENIASRIIAIFLLYYLKNLIFKNMINFLKINPEIKKDLFSYISVEKNEEIFLLIKKDLLEFFSKSVLFDLEGYINFRLKHYKFDVEKLLYDSYTMYISSTLDSSSDENNSNYFKDIINTNPNRLDELTVNVNDKGIFIVDDNCNLTFELKEQEDFFTNLILLSPKSIIIFDEFNLLNKVYVILIKQTFLERVVFYDKPNSESFNRKEGY